eukprot:jgi/Ulvmu1/1092/UM106_0008.1
MTTGDDHRLRTLVQHRTGRPAPPVAQQSSATSPSPALPDTAPTGTPSPQPQQPHHKPTCHQHNATTPANKPSRATVAATPSQQRLRSGRAPRASERTIATPPPPDSSPRRATAPPATAPHSAVPQSPTDINLFVPAPAGVSRPVNEDAQAPAGAIRMLSFPGGDQLGITSRPAPTPAQPPIRSPPAAHSAAPPSTGPHAAPPRPAAAASTQPPPAEIVVVNTAAELRAAVATAAQNIEIRSHLNLPGLALPGAPAPSGPPRRGGGGVRGFLPDQPGGARAALPPIALATQSIRGNCSSSPASTVATASAAHSMPVPLKPFQCRLTTDATLFSIASGNLWLDNLFLAAQGPTVPEGASGSTPVDAAGNGADVNSSHQRGPGVQGTLPLLTVGPPAGGAEHSVHVGSSGDGAQRGMQDAAVFLTNVTVQGDGVSHTCVLRSAPEGVAASVLAQDSVFGGIMAAHPPFIASQGTYTTFRNCLFHSVHLPHTELLDISYFGTVALVDTIFTNTTLPHGVAAAHTPTACASPPSSAAAAPSGSNDACDEAASPGSGAAAAPGFSLRFSPASADDAAHFGAEFVAEDEMVQDECGGLACCSQWPRCVAAMHAAERSGAAGAPRELMAHAPDVSGEGGPVIASRGWHDAGAAADACWACCSQQGLLQDRPGQGGGAGSGEEGLGLGFCEGGQWRPVRRGVKLSLAHPWLAALVEALPVLPFVPESQAFHHGVPVQTAAATEAMRPAHSVPVAQRDAATTLPQHGDAAEAGVQLRRARLAAVIVAAVLLIVLIMLLLLAMLRRRRARRTARRSAAKLSPVAMQLGQSANSHLRDWKTDTHINHLFDQDRSPGYVAALRAMHETPPAPLGASSSSTTRIGARPRGVSAGPPQYARMAEEEEGQEDVGSISGSESGSRGSWECEPGQVWGMHDECGSPKGLAQWRQDAEPAPRLPMQRRHQDSPFCVPGQLWKLERLDEEGPSLHAGQDHSTQRARHGVAGSLGPQDAPGSQARTERSGSLESGSSHLSAGQHAPLSDAAEPPHPTIVADPARSTRGAMSALQRQLDSFHPSALFLSQFHLLGKRHRRQGGHSIIQFVLDTRTRIQYAVKFCLDLAAFHTEAALYAAAFPHLRKLLSSGSHQFGSPTATAGLCTHPWGSGGSVGSFTGADASDRSSGDASLSPLSALMRSSPGPAANIGERRALLVPAKPYARSPVRAAVRRGGGGKAQEQPLSTERGALGEIEVAADLGAEIRPALPVAVGGAGAAHALQSFLPPVEAVCESAAAGLMDGRGRPLPPCIVMEKGESLVEWSRRQEADLFRALTILSDVSGQLAQMHDAGYVHRDLKPTNVMWLPRQSRWTVIDFGSTTRTGANTPVRVALPYSSPEEVRIWAHGEAWLQASPALDAWAVGVMAFELLSGEAAFKASTGDRAKIIAQLLGDLPLPWECTRGAASANQTGVLRGPVLRLLDRNPAARPSMHLFHKFCENPFTGTPPSSAAL